MKKSLEYLHKIYKETENSDTKSKIALIGEKLHIVNEGWGFYFSLSIDNSMNRINENILIGILVNIASVTDILYKLSGRTVSYNKGSKLELISLLRNDLIHGKKPFHLPMWQSNESGLTQISLVHIHDITRIEGLSKWKAAFEQENKEDWWDEDWAFHSKNQTIQDMLDIKKIDIDKIDSELFKMTSAYFSNYY